VFVTGGAGYVGARLVPKLLAAGHSVKVLDLFLYGDDVFDQHADDRLTLVKGDIRDAELIRRELEGSTDLVHLACISNDPSFELDPALGKSINYDAFFGLVAISKQLGVSRFLYASSSSVYGVKAEESVTEDLPLEPLTDYSKYKALCEPVLLAEHNPEFIPVVLRPATVCGYSPRLRLDLTVNLLTAHAYFNGIVKVFGGGQQRPNIHIEDLTDLYVQMLEYPVELVAGKTFNVGYENHTVAQIAEMVRNVASLYRSVQVEVVPTVDHRSYRISSKKIQDELGFVPRHTIEDAIRDLMDAFDKGKVPDAMSDDRYYNIKTMQALQLV
jgi:nucleoside-diphosphate-sugar epimerase